MRMDLTLTREGCFTTDDCDHATLLGVVRRALEASPEFRSRYGGALLALSVPLIDDLSSDSYESLLTVAPPLEAGVA